jgi:NAD dependent epimerase/dehydratase
MSEKKVLVTGADGFIGSHLAEALVRDGQKVRAFVYYNSFNSFGWLDSLPEDIRNSMEIVAGDIRDTNMVQESARGIDCIFHLAALIAIPYSYHAPESYVETNIRGTLNVLQAAKAHGVQKVVQTSTSEVYGTARRVPIDEAHPLQGQSPYSATKIGADQLALSFHAAFGLPVGIIRPFNTYGPRQSARALIPTVITQIAAGKKKILLGSLTPTRDFSFIEDTVRGFIAFANSPKSIGEIINIGSGFEVSMKETAEIIANVMNTEIEIEIEPSRIRPDNSEVERLLADIAKAERLLGWKPKYGGVSGLKLGLGKTAEWFSDPSNLSRYKTDRYNI